MKSLWLNAGFHVLTVAVGLLCGCTFHNSYGLMKDTGGRRVDSAIVRYLIIADPYGSPPGKFSEVHLSDGDVDSLRSEIESLITQVRSLPDSLRFDEDKTMPPSTFVRDSNYMSIALYLDNDDIAFIGSSHYTFFHRSSTYWLIPLGKSVRYANGVRFFSLDIYRTLKAVINDCIALENRKQRAVVYPSVP